MNVLKEGHQTFRRKYAQNRKSNMNIVIIDTETTWTDDVMSIGAVIATDQFQPIDSKYYLVEPACYQSAMYADVLHLKGTPAEESGTREDILENMKQWLDGYNVHAIYAYNAGFDKNHMPELGHYDWYDIMKLAAYRQYNRAIPDHMPCYKTGRLKSGYGVESIYRLLSGNQYYYEKHNGWHDAVDELKIMEMLGLSLEEYENAKI